MSLGSAAIQSQAPRHAVKGRVIVLILAPFSFSTGAYVFAGLIEPMAADLDVSVPMAAQLQTAFAVACALGGPLLAVATGAIGRKRLLVSVLAALAVLNALSALAEAFVPLMAARIAVGLVGSLALPVASTIAIAMVPPERRARALAIVMAGNALAFLAGIPLGSVVGGSLGWPASFWLASGLCAIAAVAVMAVIPATGPALRPPPGAFRSVLRWPLTGLFGITALAFAATFASAGLVGPLTTRLTGATGAGVGAVQAIVGVGAIVGLAVGARLAVSDGRPLTTLFCVVIAAQLLYSVGMLAGVSSAVGVVVVAVATLCGAAALFAVSPIVQTRLAEGAGPFATVAFALNGSMIFLGQGLGTALGGLTTSLFGLAWIGIAGAVVAAFGILLAARDFRNVASAAPPNVAR